jgi:hypothetical protein
MLLSHLTGRNKSVRPAGHRASTTHSSGFPQHGYRLRSIYMRTRTLQQQCGEVLPRYDAAPREVSRMACNSTDLMNPAGSFSSVRRHRSDGSASRQTQHGLLNFTWCVYALLLYMSC